MSWKETMFRLLAVLCLLATSAWAGINLICIHEEHAALNVKHFLKEVEAEQDYPGPYFCLGCYYYTGQGVPQDYKEAVKWWTKAADRGDRGAQNNLGVCYAKGLGVSQDDKVAYMWLDLAATGDEKIALEREAVEKKLSPTDLEKARQMVREKLVVIEKLAKERLTKEKAAASGNVNP